jgi:hypothetical protein
LTGSGRRLLERLAWLAPEKVPEFLLDVPVPGAETEKLREAFIDLAAYSLITPDTRTAILSRASACARRNAAKPRWWATTGKIGGSARMDERCLP